MTATICPKANIQTKAHKGHIQYDDMRYNCNFNTDYDVSFSYYVNSWRIELHYCIGMTRGSINYDKKHL